MKLNPFSSVVTAPKSQGASQAMLYATGLSARDMDKPQIGIVSFWLEGNPCNMHLLGLAERVKEAMATDLDLIARLGVGIEHLLQALDALQVHNWILAPFHPHWSPLKSEVAPFG